MSDMWATYDNIDTISNGVYLHSTINYSLHYVHPVYQEMHTQNVENMWIRAKRKLKRQFGTSQGLFDSYLEEFTFKGIGNTNFNIFTRFFLSCRTERVQISTVAVMYQYLTWHFLCDLQCLPVAGISSGN